MPKINMGKVKKSIHVYSDQLGEEVVELNAMNLMNILVEEEKESQVCKED